MKSYYRHDYAENQRTYHRTRRRRLIFAIAKRGTAAVAVAGALALGAAAWSALGPGWVQERLASAGLFRIEAVRVGGNRVLQEADVRALAGVRVGGSLFGFDLEAGRSRLTAHPRVREATLRRRLPGTVAIEVVERVPCAIVRAERDLLVDAEGAVVGLAAGSDAAGLPVLTGVGTAGGRLTARGAQDLAAGLELIAALRSAGFPALSAVDHIDLSDPEDALIVPLSGRPLVHAGRGNAAAQLGRWRLVAPDMARRWQELEYVDLRVEGQVVALPAAPAEAPGGDQRGPTAQDEEKRAGDATRKAPAKRPGGAAAAARGGHA